MLMSAKSIKTTRIIYLGLKKKLSQSFFSVFFLIFRFRFACLLANGLLLINNNILFFFFKKTFPNEHHNSFYLNWHFSLSSFLGIVIWQYDWSFFFHNNKINNKSINDTHMTMFMIKSAASFSLCVEFVSSARRNVFLVMLSNLYGNDIGNKCWLTWMMMQKVTFCYFY